jgi:hypothetical protein
MTARELAARLARHGPDFAAWPPEAARAARACLLRSATCRRLYVRALEQDAALAAEPLTADGAMRLRRLGEQVARTPQRGPGFSRQAAWRGGALAACLVVGLLVGWYSAPAPRPAPLLVAAVDLTPFTGSGQ